MRTIRVLLIAAFVAAGLVLPSAASAATTSIAISPSTPVAGQRFTVRGTVPTTFARTVRLQRSSGGRWVTVQSRRTTSRGAYAFTLASVASSITLRTQAIATTHRKHRYGTRTSAKKVVRPRVQKASLKLARAGGRLTAAATFSPAVKGRAITFSSLSGSTWKVVGRSTQSSKGTATLTLAEPTPGTHRFRAATSGGGIPTITSSQATVTIEPPPPPAPALERTARVDITTQDGLDIMSGDTYSPATMTIDPRGSGLPGTTVPANLRVRGNSTAWISIKYAYKVKLDAKSAMLGMPKSKNWVLLANFYDRSMLRNESAFEISRRMNLPWTPRMHFVEVWLNGTYRGLYQLGEGVEAESDRVKVPDGGYLLEADSQVDDDPSFRTARGLQVFFKDPDDAGPDERAEVAARVQVAEDSLYAADFDDPVNGYAAHLDVDSFVDWYLVNELTKNIDASMQNSVWMVLAPDGRLSMGPVWDFDQSMGNRVEWDVDDPTGWFVRRNYYVPSPPAYSIPSQIRVPEGQWFTRLLTDPSFERKVRARWNELSLADLPTYVSTLAEGVAPAAARNFAPRPEGAAMPIGETFLEANHVFHGSWEAEVAALQTWLAARVAWMDGALGE